MDDERAYLNGSLEAYHEDLLLEERKKSILERIISRIVLGIKGVWG
tara:strand:+ start:4312 stop:4449 length:138 start_codon:yes stop_codon:yes gene_type:complete